jgi:hypothetical protein
MAQIQVNPWEFTSADQATTVGINSIVNNGGASALVTTASAHGYALYQNVSIQGPAVAGYANGYKVLSIPSTSSYLVQLLPNQFSLANAGAGGNSLSVAYPYKVRIEQVLWNNATATTSVLITDTNGFNVWNPTAGAAGTVGPYTYGKLYWVDGLVINALPNGNVQMTIN